MLKYILKFETHTIKSLYIHFSFLKRRNKVRFFEKFKVISCIDQIMWNKWYQPCQLLTAILSWKQNYLKYNEQLIHKNRPSDKRYKMIQLWDSEFTWQKVLALISVTNTIKRFQDFSPQEKLPLEFSRCRTFRHKDICCKDTTL